MCGSICQPSFFKPIHKFLSSPPVPSHPPASFAHFSCSLSNMLSHTLMHTWSRTLLLCVYIYLLKIPAHRHMTHSHICTWHTHCYCKQSLSCESYFQAESKKLCLAQDALEQITLFDLLDFGLYVQRWPGKEMFCNHVDQQTNFIMMSLCCDCVFN